MDRVGRPRTTQLGNYKQVIVIKTIYMRGFIVLLLIIFKVVIYQVAQYKDRLILPNQVISISKNSQITNKIGLQQLKYIFNKYIKDYILSYYQLLILNSYSSYVTPKFNQYYLKHLIIILYMPPYLLYLLQLLNISYFSVLK